MVLGKYLSEIRPNGEKKVKKQALSKSFFHILHGAYFLKQKVVVAQIPDWRFNVNIGRNATFEGRLGQNFCPIWVKNGKRLIIFKNIAFVSHS